MHPKNKKFQLPLHHDMFHFNFPLDKFYFTLQQQVKNCIFYQSIFWGEIDPIDASNWVSL